MLACAHYSLLLIGRQSIRWYSDEVKVAVFGKCIWRQAKELPVNLVDAYKHPQVSGGVKEQAARPFKAVHTFNAMHVADDCQLNCFLHLQLFCTCQHAIAIEQELCSTRFRELHPDNPFALLIPFAGHLPSMAFGGREWLWHSWEHERMTGELPVLIRGSARCGFGILTAVFLGAS